MTTNSTMEIAGANHLHISVAIQMNLASIRVVQGPTTETPFHSHQLTLATKITNYLKKALLFPRGFPLVPEYTD